MAAPPQSKSPQIPAAARRPLSPHLTIYRWPVTMMTSITHRATGMALTVGALILAWWLVSISNGLDGGYQNFMALAATPFGMLVLFGITWSLAYHFFNGLRHLAWDLGYGFDKKIAERNSVIVFALSFLSAIAIFAIVLTGHGGYLQ
jgi:succinate dehydrogenase / fumarate reductase cytochrome b subunit